MKKVTVSPSFPATPPLKIEVPSSPPLFWKLGRRFTPHPTPPVERGMGLHTMNIKIHFDKLKRLMPELFNAQKTYFDKNFEACWNVGILMKKACCRYVIVKTSSSHQWKLWHGRKTNTFTWTAYSLINGITSRKNSEDVSRGTLGLFLFHKYHFTEKPSTGHIFQTFQVHIFL